MIGNSYELDHPCTICGLRESFITVKRKWLEQLISSDECVECHEYMNTHLSVPPIYSANETVIYINSSPQYRRVIT